VEHEAQQMTIAGMCQFQGVHTDGVAILGKQLSGDRLKNRKTSAQGQGNPGKRNQESTIAKKNFQKAAFISHWH
jgi:hypothetical protein